MNTDAFCCSNDASSNNGDGCATARFVYTNEEREILRSLINKYRAVLENKKTNNASKGAKNKAWEKLGTDYNSQPNVRPRTVKQLKKCWDNEKSRWKKKDSQEKRDIYATGGGPRTCRPMSPSLLLVGAVASHMATRLPNPHDSDNHDGQPVLSLSPATIFESMVDPTNDCLDDVQGTPASQAQSPLRASSEDAGASGHAPQTASETHRDPETPAVRRGGGRIAALERMFAPEKEARVAACQKTNDQQELEHQLRMRLLRGQLAHQRRHNKRELQHLEYRHSMEKELLHLDIKIKQNQLESLTRQLQ
ncbi:myb/SANT-like DNA-binding domain-containing protein 3 [Ornithodoros turicata]|uniref:myb/SANT-like DNA-binding domain-containing protein 3 n=1 Tax=Ornithodoros turicata TaxID=34597 RepID=UPI0031399476